MPDNEPGSKEEMRDYRRDKVTEQTLRQFLKLESGMYGGKVWRKNYDLALGHTDPMRLEESLHCQSCDYVAETAAEHEWHESRNPGHKCG